MFTLLLLVILAFIVSGHIFYTTRWDERGPFVLLFGLIAVVSVCILCYRINANMPDPHGLLFVVKKVVLGESYWWGRIATFSAAFAISGALVP